MVNYGKINTKQRQRSPNKIIIRVRTRYSLSEGNGGKNNKANLEKVLENG